MMQWWRNTIAKLKALWRRRSAPPPQPPLEPPPATFEPPPEPPPPSEPPPNRAQRRKLDHDARVLERRRRKFDKFVEPKGEAPRPLVRRNDPEPRPRSPEPEFVDDGNDFLIVDTHHSDRKTEVLYYAQELYGEFNFRDTILDQLERYFVYLERMRKHDPDAYKFYGYVGAHLSPYISSPDIFLADRPRNDVEYKKFSKLTPWFLEHRPSFGCIAYGTSPEVEKIESGAYREKSGKLACWIPKFLYFLKYEDRRAPPEVQPKTGGNVYCMTVWWDKPEEKRMKYGSPEEYPIFVGNDGHIEILRIISTKRYPIVSKKYGRSSIPRREYRLPNHADHWAKTHHTDARHLLHNLFCDLTAHVERAAYSMCKVSVTNSEGQHAMFSIDPRRMGYFFQDRDYQLTESGRRKRIFHSVRAHARSDGKVIKMHFRGEREFEWDKYHVRVTVPGLDHGMLEEISSGVGDMRRFEDGDKVVTEGEFGRFLRSNIDGRPIKVKSLKLERIKKR